MFYNMKKVVITLSLLVFLIPLFVNAQSREDIIADLLTQLNALMQQLEELKAGTHDVGVGQGSSSPSSAMSCISFNQNLYLGSRGSDVFRLQKFLTQTGDFTYPEITGYFGPATERAVMRWQARNGVVSSGSAETTGYGVFGPSTRSAIQKATCGNTTTRPPRSGEGHPSDKVILSVDGEAFEIGNTANFKIIYPKDTATLEIDHQCFSTTGIGTKGGAGCGETVTIQERIVRANQSNGYSWPVEFVSQEKSRDDFVLDVTALDEDGQIIDHNDINVSVKGGSDNEDDGELRVTQTAKDVMVGERVTFRIYAPRGTEELELQNHCSKGLIINGKTMDCRYSRTETVRLMGDQIDNPEIWDVGMESLTGTSQGEFTLVVIAKDASGKVLDRTQAEIDVGGGKESSSASVEIEEPGGGERFSLGAYGESLEMEFDFSGPDSGVTFNVKLLDERRQFVQYISTGVRARDLSFGWLFPNSLIKNGEDTPYRIEVDCIENGRVICSDLSNVFYFSPTAEIEFSHINSKFYNVEGHEVVGREFRSLVPAGTERLEYTFGCSVAGGNGTLVSDYGGWARCGDVINAYENDFSSEERGRYHNFNLTAQGESGSYPDGFTVHIEAYDTSGSLIDQGDFSISFYKG